MCNHSGCDRPARTKGLCPKHYAAARRKADPEKERVNSAAWRARHPERAKDSYSTWLAANREWDNARRRAYSKTPRGAAKSREQTAKRRAAKRQTASPYVGYLRDLPCALCGASAPSQVDHIVPLSWAPGCPYAVACCEDPRCYQSLCGSCNSAKSNRGVWSYVPTGDIG